MSWAKSLIRISTYEVEVLQKRLSAVVEQRVAAEIKRAVLDAEGEAEAIHARDDAEAGWSYIAFRDGLRLRKSQADAEILRLKLEEHGAREALAGAFEAQKKYEHVAENARRLELKETARREGAAMDDLGMRRSGAGR